jgi:hypothetical protein
MDLKGGDQYLGQLNGKNLPDGFGVIVRKKTGNMYQGMFINGKEQGKGIMYWGKGK